MKDESDLSTCYSSTCNSSSSVFDCPEIGCTKQYQHFSKLQNHIEFGRYAYKLERKSTYDEI